MKNRGAAARRRQMDSDVAPDSRRRPVEALVLDDGTRAVVAGGGLEIRDNRGRLLVRYADGAATIEVPEGDLTLSAPGGRVAIRSAEDIVLEAAGELRQSAGRRLTLSAGAIVTSADSIVETASRVERTAERLIERARDVFRDVTELSQSRIGRVRAIIRDSYSLTSNRTTMTSKEDTSIDGKRILLG